MLANYNRTVVAISFASILILSGLSFSNTAIAQTPTTYLSYGYGIIPPGQYKFVSIPCDAGDIAVGGTAVLHPIYGEVIYDYPALTYNSSLGNYEIFGWNGYFHNTYSYDVYGWVYVDCLDIN